MQGTPKAWEWTTSRDWGYEEMYRFSRSIYRELAPRVIDDDHDVAEYVRRELEEESFNVVVAHDGAAGLRLAESSAFDILVLDVMMPFMDGLQLTRSLRRQSI